MQEFKEGTFVEFTSNGRCSMNEEFVEVWKIEKIENGVAFMTRGDNKADYLNYKFRELSQLNNWTQSPHKQVGVFKRLKGTDEILKSYE